MGVQIVNLLVMTDNAPLSVSYVVTVDGIIWTSETFERSQTSYLQGRMNVDCVTVKLESHY
jgi:hypothetical protein